MNNHQPLFGPTDGSPATSGLKAAALNVGLEAFVDRPEILARLTGD